MAPVKKQLRLRVSVGPSANPKDLKPIAVNDDANPVWIESDEFVGQIVIRVKDLDRTAGYEQGANEDNLKTVPDSAWFHNSGEVSHINSIQIHGRFKRGWAGDQILFGSQFERPLRLPPFASAVMKFFHLMNPTLEAELAGTRPSAFCPLIAVMNTVKVSEHMDTSLGADLPPWPSKAGEHITEDTALLFASRDDDSSYASLDDKKKTATMASSERRSYFTKLSNLKNFTFRPDEVYDFDFFNQFLDLSAFRVKIPGLSINLSQPLDGQPLTFVGKSKDNSVIFFAVQFEMVPVEASQ
ncbi:hypothetical protein BGZ93_003263 [Podila epicladia]|nr:hypothetical protein BGZ92_000742 [Podila epicladia]KAG0097179.1 hypothetical protein BGZ93_003263 [Podila epicladia]